MAEKRRKKKLQDEQEKPTKEEYAVAEYLRFNVSNKEGKLMSMPVQCFIASKAVDCLLDSKWATNKGKSNALFTTRSSCVDYCNRLLAKGMFHRALRQERSKDKKKKKDTLEKTEEKIDKSKGKKSKKREKEEEKGSKEEKKSDEENKEIEKRVEKKDEEKKKKKERKYKLEMHDVQKFIDGDEVYVWIYDPVPLKNKIIGLFLVLGAIGVCLFPLWPPEVRLGVYYLSLAAAGFVGLILVLCVVRVIVFGMVWGLTFGKHHLWIFPNLTEDVGILDSFKPLYEHEAVTKSDASQTDNNTTDESKNTESLKESVDLTVGDSNVECIKTLDELDAKEDGSVVEETKEDDSGDSNGYELVQHEELEAFE